MTTASTPAPTATAAMTYYPIQWTFVDNNAKSRKLEEKLRKMEEEEYAKAIAKAEKQRWRPCISSNREDNFSWWSLGEPDFGTARKEYYRYQNNWVGLTLCSISKFEFNLISKFIGKYTKKEIFNIAYISEYGNFSETNVSQIIPDNISSEDWIELGAESVSIWFRDLETHNKFISFLENIPQRDIKIDLGATADISTIEELLKDKNYYIKIKKDIDDNSIIDGFVNFVGDEKTAILIKMFAG